jgi:ribosomal-protein-alanine N-acetyltransferase
VQLRAPSRDDCRPFLAAVAASRRLHGAWVSPPSTPALFRAWLARLDDRGRHASYLALRVDDGSLVGVFNFSEIVRGAFQSTYLGYYAFAPNAARGYMTEAFLLALDAAFGRLRLHRVEANVQPGNERSVALVERVGFAREGFSRRYVKVAGRWRDHVRYAMLAEDWTAARSALLARRRDPA